MRTMRGRNYDAAALHLRERISIDVNDDDDDDGDDAANCSALTFRLNVCAHRLHARSPGQAADARAKTGEAATSRSHRQLR